MSLEGVLAFAAVGGLLILLLVLLLGVVVWRLRDARVRAATVHARLAALLESDASGLAVWNAEGRLVACNGRFREFYPSVTLKPGLEYEDLVRYTATRAVVLVPEAEMDAWIAARLGRLGEPAAETLRTPDGRLIEVRTRATGQGETVLVYTDVTKSRTAAAAAGAEERRTSQGSALRMLQEAADVGRDAASFHQALRDVVRLVAEWGGWDAGTAYLVTADGSGALVSTGVWHVPDEDGLPSATRAAIDESTEACGAASDDHVLRRAVSSAEPTWIASISVDPRLADARRTAFGDVRSLCTVPVTSAGQVVAVVELFSRAPLPPDAARERLVASAVDQLARVFERDRTRLTAGPRSDRAG